MLLCRNQSFSILYHNMQKSAMGAVRKKSQNENMGAKMEPGTARLYHIIRKSSMGAPGKNERKMGSSKQKKARIAFSGPSIHINIVTDEK